MKTLPQSEQPALFAGADRGLEQLQPGQHPECVVYVPTWDGGVGRFVIADERRWRQWLRRRARYGGRR